MCELRSIEYGIYLRLDQETVTVKVRSDSKSFLVI